MVAPAINPATAPPVTGTISDNATNVGSSRPKLTRSQVADQLDVSISTVRRLEGTRLHPEIGPGNTRLFDPAEVAMVAGSLARMGAPTPEPKPSAISRGELAARIFERFEHRYSLSEIVIELRVAPDLVRELFHQWCVGLEQGEVRRVDGVSRAPEAREVRESELRDLLGAFGKDQSIRLSVARVTDERIANGERSYEVAELGGFTVTGPSSPAALINHYGWSRFRLCAVDVASRSVLWLVITPHL